MRDDILLKINEHLKYWSTLPVLKKIEKPVLYEILDKTLEQGDIKFINEFNNEDLQLLLKGAIYLKIE